MFKIKFYTDTSLKVHQYRLNLSNSFRTIPTICVAHFYCRNDLMSAVFVIRIQSFEYEGDKYPKSILLAIVPTENVTGDILGYIVTTGQSNDIEHSFFSGEAPQPERVPVGPPTRLIHVGDVLCIAHTGRTVLQVCAPEIWVVVMQVICISAHGVPGQMESAFVIFPVAIFLAIPAILFFPVFGYFPSKDMIFSAELTVTNGKSRRICSLLKGQL